MDTGACRVLKESTATSGCWIGGILMDCGTCGVLKESTAGGCWEEGRLMDCDGWGNDCTKLRQSLLADVTRYAAYTKHVEQYS